MPKAALTGATGFVGGALLRELLRRGWSVRVLVREGSDTRNLQDLDRPFERFQGDVRDREGLRQGFAGCDFVFHVAARYSLWNPRPREIYQDNVDGTRNVLEAAEAAGVKRIVYTSTVGVLKIPADGQAGDETAIALAGDIAGHYKRSKWLAEACASELAARGLPVVIVNPSTPVGPNDVKPTPTGRMIVDFLNGRMKAYTNTGLNLVPVEDVAVGHILAAERGVHGERYILGGENLSLGQICAKLSGLTGLLAPRFCIPRRFLLPLAAASQGLSAITGRPPMIPIEAARMAQKHMFFDSSRARKELGYAPGDVGPALEKAIRWFHDNGYVFHRRDRRGALTKAERDHVAKT